MFRDELGLTPIDKAIVFVLVLLENWGIMSEQKVDKLIDQYNERRQK